MSASLIGQSQDQQQPAFLAKCPEDRERLAFEWVMWARDDYAFWKVVVVGSVW
jgi:hypothetical protein